MKLLAIFCLCLFYSSVLTEKNIERTRTGVCPPSSERECFDQKTDCEVDEDCEGQTKCCSNGCVNKCVTPHYTGCQQLSLVLERQARSLGPEGKDTFIPRCDKSGKFEPVQCNDISEMCWCVNQQGFEIAGTRARSLNILNCSAPDKCAGHTCRMLCPYGFELDDYGCPVCECRDPCKGVKCPANQKCEVEEIPCVEEVCPPLPTCKQPRTLDSFCPVGEPITSPDSGHPILCGMEPNKPQCPHSYLCNVLPGNDYGVCCPLVDKQGTCPSEVDNEECGGSCQSDMDCVDVKKCCYSDVCGHSCVKPENTTLCLQQKAVVELLASNNAKFQGYVPQCTETGEFLPKQCTTNGALCWCVDSTGVQIRGTIGPSSTVDCLLEIRSDQNPDATVCKNTTCDLHCEFGFRYDDWGCVKCECDDPCQDMECPHGSECIVLKEDPCMSIYCPPVASCHRTQGDMCSKGRPLLDTKTQELVHCGENSCPLKTFVCEQNPEDDMGICCPASFVIESSKEGNCPQYIAEPRYCGNNTCIADDECEGFKKCCPSDVCGAICVNPEPKGLPTMCQYLHEMGRKLIGTDADEFLAVSVPQCHEDGSYEPIQCNDGGECWCVDEFGVEINMTRAPSFDQVDCRRVRARLECSGVLCRLGCDYGFEHDHVECPICACRNPCKDAKCPEGYKCQMTEVVCEDTWCPPIPKCMRVKTQSRNFLLHCPAGDPMLNENNIPMICNPQTGVQHCPDTHVCLVPDPVTPGICCPRNGEGLSLVDSSEDNLSVSSSTEKQNVSSGEKQGTCPIIESWEVGHCAEECNVDSDCSGPQKCCTNGCGAHVCRDPAGTTGKLGQCPYLVPQSLGSCEYECTSDYDCEDIKKCCSNGCGTQCLVPLTLTACQHQRAIAEYRAREAGIPASQVFLPLCDKETGVFKDVQCNPLTKECWCVDIHGYEVAGTRSLPGETTNCSGSTVCPVLACKMDCPAGLKLDESGCPLCECADPCREVICSSSVEECRLVQLTCSTDPCPPVPLCLPRITNPCQSGEPLIDVNTGNELKCGPQGSQCPSSHRCNLSPFGEFAVCCPKPRDVCFAEKDVGRCKSSLPRWFFNAQKDVCEEFRFGGCGGNLNNFNYREDCEKTCHALSHCEKVRERNLKYLKHSNGAVFIPKCNKETGDWATVQCFDSIGLCWCASKDGEQVPGSIVRGTPHCTSRMGRTLDETSICPDGNPVYLCPANLCDNQHCLAHPNATCRVNPCRGCTPVFYDEMNHPVDCNDGLTTCARKVQKVLNSHAWANQGLPLNRIEDFLPVKLQHQNNSAPSLPFHFSLLLTSKKDIKHKEQDIEPVVKRSAWNTNPGLQMMTSRLSLMIGPEASNVKVRIFGNNHDMWDMIRPETTNMKIRLSGNNDNLWDMIRPETTNMKIRLSGNNYNLWDMIRPEDIDTRIRFPGDNDNMWDMIRPEDTKMNIRFPGDNDNMWDMIRPEDTKMNIRFPGDNDNLWDMIRPEDTKMNIRFAGDNENLWDMIQPEDTNMNIRFAGDNGNLWEMVRPQATIMKFRLPDINEDIWKRFFKINPFTPKLVKQGVCPIPSLSSVFRSMIQGCDNNCMVDSDCPGNRKCCITACGFDCLEPFIPSQNTSPKSGTCPSKVLIDFSCSQPRRDCIVDHDCPASSKCCLTSCGPTCLQPQALPVEPVNMVVMPPTCSSDGGFAAAQSQGELSWCVDDGGNPLHNTLTRGLVTCDAKGRILGRQEIDPVCPGYDSKPRVCTDECFTAYCPLHPDAVCVADPCRDCATTFVNQAGEKVWCEDKCSQPLVVGNCRSSLPRYFYNKTSESCEQFNFGGCEGNDNNFESLEECQEACVLAVPVCDQPRDIGLCRGYMPRWFYNQQTHTCEEFIYGGCGGNENNFETKEECDARCPDLILCPWISVKGENLEPCSRMKACLNATCPANPVAVCTADPCSCKAVFVNNQTGKPVECFGESTSEPTHIVTPTVPRHTRCENSRQQHLADKTLENNYIAQCDLKGQFLPIQCAMSPNSVLYDEECWCVDEAGIQLPGTTTFPRGSQNCEPVKVKRVEVTLAFKHPSMDQASTSLDHVKRMIQQVLDDLAVDGHDTALETEIFKDRLHVNFNLTGDQKVDDAFHLENMIRGETVLHVSGVELPSDFRNSHFFHIIDYVPKKISKASYLRDLDNKETGENKHKWNLSSTVIGVIIVVTVVVALLVLLLVIFMAQRQRGKQFELKPPPTSIAFSSLIYGITDKSQNTKIPVNEKVNVQTVEAQYQSMLEKDDAVSELSEAPPGYDNISDHDVKV